MDFIHRQTISIYWSFGRKCIECIQILQLYLFLVHLRHVFRLTSSCVIYSTTVQPWLDGHVLLLSRPEDAPDLTV